MIRSPLPLGTIVLDPEANAPLYRQLYDALRTAILEGRLVAGSRLPSSRTLAGDLGVGRNTVLSAYEQLAAEGYLEGQVGAGTRVAAALPDRLLEVGRNAREQAPESAAPSPALSRRGEAMASIRRAVPRYERGIGRAFQHGLPAIDLFPAALWSRLLARRARDPRAGLFGYETGEGFKPLREAIAAYAGAARGVVCTPDQVIVTAGAQAALDLAARMVIDPGDPVWLEEPGYLGARGAFLGAGATLVPVQVDHEGLDVEAGIAAEPHPRLIYVTPSHQFPLGVTLSLQRRLALLDFARRAGAWIIEDDYDSEYRYTGRPIASLQGLDRAGRTLYMGTFAKTLFPALKVGYLIVPDGLIDPFRRAIRISGHVPPAAIQSALADFIGEGHFGTHVRRMLPIYAERRARLLQCLDGELAEFLEPAPSEGGIQIAAWLRDGKDRAASDAAARADVHASPLSSYYLDKDIRPGLHLGYAAVPEPVIVRAASRLRSALAEMRRGNIPGK
jgi:GntR family transcriptional regulator/MocR family aminotransferase